MTYSPKFSFKGWDLWKYAKGRKKLAVTIVGGLLGYFISNDETIAVVSASAVEMVFALVDYYVKSKSS